MSLSGKWRNQLYRDPENGKIAGVCAGIADYLSWDVNVVRLMVIVLAVIFSLVVVGLYGCAAYCLKPKPTALYGSLQEEADWRRYQRSPTVMLSSVRDRFLRLEQKLNRLEAYVTSGRYHTDREFERMRRY